MQQMSFNQYLAFVQGCSAGQIEVTGIKNPQSESNYTGKELSEQQEQFVRDANSYDSPAQIQVTVQDLVTDKESDWMDPQDVGAWISNLRGQNTSDS